MARMLQNLFRFKTNILVIFSVLLVTASHAQEHALPLSYNFKVCSGDTVSLSVPSFEGGIRIWPENGPFLSVIGDTVTAFAVNTSDSVICYTGFLSTYIASIESVFNDTIKVFIYPELQTGVNLPDLEYTICSGDTQQVYYPYYAFGTMYTEPYTTSQLVTNESSPYFLLYPEETTSYDLYVENEAGCRLGPFPLNVEVYELNGLPRITLLADTICIDSEPFELNYSPLWAQLAGPGVGLDNMFYPELAGSGTHYLTLSASITSCAFSTTEAITILSADDVSMTDIPNICSNEQPLLLNGIGLPTGGYFYGAGISADAQQQYYLNPSEIQPGSTIVNYAYRTDDACTITVEQTLFIKTVPPKPELTIFGDSSTCQGDTLVLGSSIFANRYLWSTGDTTQYISAFNQADYYVSIVASNGCTNFSDTTFLGFYPAPTIDLFSPEVISGFNSSGPGIGDGSIDLSLEGGVPPFKILWSNGEMEEDIDRLTSGWYIVTITDNAGCVVVDSIFLSDPVNTSIGSIAAEGEFRGIKIPNGFTPNGDGFNDTWKIMGLSPALERNEVLVFDTRGSLVYRMQNYFAQWDGRDLKGNMLPEGDYFWVFRSANADGILRGSVNLRR